jgi:hypothetical protein
VAENPRRGRTQDISSKSTTAGTYQKMIPCESHPKRRAKRMTWKQFIRTKKQRAGVLRLIWRPPKRVPEALLLGELQRDGLRKRVREVVSRVLKMRRKKRATGSENPGCLPARQITREMICGCKQDDHALSSG